MNESNERDAFAKRWPNDDGVLSLAENNPDFALESIGARHRFAAYKAGWEDARAAAPQAQPCFATQELNAAHWSPPQAQPSRSDKQRDAGFTRRPDVIGKRAGGLLRPDAEDEAQAAPVVQAINDGTRYTMRPDGTLARSPEPAPMRDALTAIMRAADAAKEPCGQDPESPAAVRNGRFASIAQMAAQGLGIVRGPAFTVPAPISDERIDTIWITLLDEHPTLHPSGFKFARLFARALLAERGQS